MPRDRRKSKGSEADDIETRIREHIRSLGRQGGKKRSQNLTPERRREIARNAALTRWSKTKKKKKAP